MKKIESKIRNEGAAHKLESAASIYTDFTASPRTNG